MLAYANRITQADDYRAVVRRGRRFVAPNTVTYIRTPLPVSVEPENSGSSTGIPATPSGRSGNPGSTRNVVVDSGTSAESSKPGSIAEVGPRVPVSGVSVSENPLDTVAQLGEPRFGFIVAKTVGIAVKRNLVRRRMKALCYAALPDVKPGYDIVIRALPGAASQPFDVLENEIASSLRSGRVLV